MKIYFAGSIRGGREDARLYADLIELLGAHGTVLTEHVGNSELSSEGEITRTSEYIYSRDVAWIDESDVVVAEVSMPSTGVGYEVGYSERSGKPVLCIYRKSAAKQPSAMVLGNPKIQLSDYETLEDAKLLFKKFFV